MALDASKQKSSRRNGGTIPTRARGLFQPKREDGRAYWRIALDRVASAAPGELILQSELLALLETDDKMLLYASMARAAKELRKHSQRDIAPVRGRGYRVLYANEHVGKADSHKHRAERQLKIANDVIDATDLAALSESERELWSQVKRGMVLLYQAVSSHEMAIARHETLIASLQSRIEGLERG
jgi:hypothetical protein